MHRNLFELNTITSHDIKALDFPMDEFGHFGLFNCKIIVIGFYTPRGSVNQTLTFSLGAHNDTQNKFWLIHLMGSIISFTLTIHAAHCTIHVKFNLYLICKAMLNGFCARRGINSTRTSVVYDDKTIHATKALGKKPKWLKRPKV